MYLCDQVNLVSNGIERRSKTSSVYEKQRQCLCFMLCFMFYISVFIFEYNVFAQTPTQNINLIYLSFTIRIGRYKCIIT